MQLKNLDFIQRQDDRDKPRLSTAYMKAAVPHDFSDPFKSGSAEKPKAVFKATEAVKVPDKPHVITEGGAEDFSLAKQLGIDEAGLARPSTLDKVFKAKEPVKEPTDDNMLSIGDLAAGPSKAKEGTAVDNKFGLAADAATKSGPEAVLKAMGDKVKVRDSNIFQSKEYFKNKMRRDLETITEDEEGKPRPSHTVEEQSVAAAAIEESTGTKPTEETNVAGAPEEQKVAEGERKTQEQPGEPAKTDEAVPKPEEEAKKLEAKSAAAPVAPKDKTDEAAVEGEKKPESAAAAVTEAEKKPETVVPATMAVAEPEKKDESAPAPVPENKTAEPAVPVPSEPEKKAESAPAAEGKTEPAERTIVEKPVTAVKKPGAKATGQEEGIGTDEVPELVPKPSSEEMKAEAARAIQEKFANKIKEQNKKVAAVLSSSGVDIRPSKISSFDFLTLKRNDKISKMLSTQREAGSAIIFSDYIYMIREDNLSHKSKRILYITEYSLYILHHTSYQIQRITPITDLKMLILVKTSGTLTALHFEKAYPFLLF